MKPKSNEEEIQVAETFDKELADIKEKGKELKGDQKKFYSSIVQRVENNVHVLSDLREEHTILRNKLGEMINMKREIGNEPDLAVDLKHRNHEVNLLKKQIDMLKHNKEDAINRQRELEIILANFQNAAESSHPEYERIKTLKNKLDKASIKNNETKHLMKIYSSVINQYDRQSMLWNPIVQDTQQEINQKHKDIAELTLIARDSKYSKAVATTEYNTARNKWETQKIKRETQLERKKKQLTNIANRRMLDIEPDSRNSKPQPSLNSQPSVLRNKVNKQKKEQREEKYRQVLIVYEQIRDAFGTNDPQKIANFFTEKRETNETLNKQIEDLRKACKILTQQIEDIKTSIEEEEFTSAKGIGGNRMMSEGKKILEKKKEEYKKLQREIEAFAKHQTEITTGVHQLSEILQLVTLDEEHPPIDPEELIEWEEDKTVEIIQAMDDEQDMTQLTNRQILVNHIQRSEVTFDMQKVDSSKRGPKRIFDTLKRPIKDPKAEQVSRVLDRQAVKMMALKAVQQQKKPIPNAPYTKK